VSRLVLYDTRTRAKRPFEPLEPDHVRMYTCGPTVYSAQHLGNLRSQLFADLLRRAFEMEGWRVTHVVNVTDVGHLTDDADAGEDKIEQAARESGLRAQEIAERYTRQWLRDREAVGCRPPEVLCRATEHIPEQIEMIRVLEQKGFTYRIDDGVYFDTAKFPRYAEFAGLDLAAQAAGGRIGDAAGKRQPADFALWKFAKAGVRRQQEWDSPWGRGFPGWHIECSAMAVRYLGRRFDVHTGGVDHVAVHHTNEIAQAECALDVHPWVQFWMHNEFLDIRGEKMAKSRGNVTLLEDVEAQGIPPLAFRYFFLQAHYRQQQTFTDAAMEAAATGYDRLLLQAVQLRQAGGAPDAAALAAPRERFRAAVRDDLNAPRALAVAWEVVRDAGLAPASRWALLADFDRVLGLDLAGGIPRQEARASDPRIDALVAEREAARARRDFARSDRIRDELLAEGILVEDTPEGPRWRRK
jgi:cysteinyl-tRNA synthetase